VAIAGLRGTNVAHTLTLNLGASAAMSTFAPLPETDRVPRPSAPSQRIYDHDDTKYSADQITSLILQNCRTIMSQRGSAHLARRHPELRQGHAAHEANFKLVGPFTLSRSPDGGFMFREQSGGPPGTKSDSLSIKLDGRVTYLPGTRAKPRHLIDPIEGRENATYDMLTKCLSATNKYVATPAHLRANGKVNPKIANQLSGLHNRVAR
jgi:hypothetical protein